MTLSFRTRLVLVAALTVAATLAVVLAVVWVRVLDFEIGRLDARLCQEARRLATMYPARRDRPGLAADLVGKLRLGNLERLRYQIGPPDTDWRAVLSNWEPAVDANRIDWQAQETWSRPAEPDNDQGRRRGPFDAPGRRRGDCALAAFPQGGRDWRVVRCRKAARCWQPTPPSSGRSSGRPPAVDWNWQSRLQPR